MAAVTQAGQPQRHVIGDLVMRIFTVSGASGSTLATGMTNILWIDAQQSTAAGTISLITAIAVSGQQVTFTSSSTMVSEVIQVIARVG